MAEDNNVPFTMATVAPKTMLSVNISEPEISFFLEDKESPVIVLKPGKFIYNGQELEDVHQAYEAFLEWLKATRTLPS